jgi:hypothetical protein
MQRIFGLILIGVSFATIAMGQIKKQFSVEDSPSCDQIKLKLKANSGTCFLKPSHNTEILNVFSNQDVDAYSHQFNKELKGKVCEVRLALEEVISEGISQNISYKVFGSEKPSEDNFWKMYLTDSNIPT